MVSPHFEFWCAHGINKLKTLDFSWLEPVTTFPNIFIFVFLCFTIVCVFFSQFFLMTFGGRKSRLSVICNRRVARCRHRWGKKSTCGCHRLKQSNPVPGLVVTLWCVTARLKPLRRCAPVRVRWTLPWLQGYCLTMTVDSDHRQLLNFPASYQHHKQSA